MLLKYMSSPGTAKATTNGESDLMLHFASKYQIVLQLQLQFTVIR